jgi:diguanylate cyclase (GGDEF)-like protein
MTPFPADFPPASRLFVFGGALRRVLPRRSPEALVLALLLAAAGARLAAIAAFGSDAAMPARLSGALAVCALIMAAGTLALGDGLPRWAFLAQVVGAVVLHSAIVATSPTAAGVLTHSLAYGWLVVYVALFFPAAAGWVALLVAAGFGLAVLATGLPDPLGPWVAVTLSTAAVGQVLSRLSLAVRAHLTTDSLTGVLNRGGLAVAAERVRRRTEALSVAVLDLDAFKAVNDRQGHAGGDRLLAELTQAWRAAMRGDDVLARTGGDEFVLVMPRTSPEQAELVLDRLRGAHPVRWSAGVARWRHGEALERCMARADARLYAAKAERARG